MRAWAWAAVGLLQACATTKYQPTPTELRLFGSLDSAQQAFEKRDVAALETALLEAKQVAGDDLHLQDRVASVEIAVLVERDDLETAWRRMTERLKTFSKPGLIDQGLHDEAIFLCEARHDRLCALLEADEMLTAGARIDAAPTRMQLGNWWQRAHTLRSLAETLEGPNRVAAIAYAERARAQFTMLARETKQSLPSIEILTEQFASLDGDCPTAMKAAHATTWETLDLQDAYVTVVALETCGEAQNAQKLRQQILANRELGLIQSVYRYLVRTSSH